MNERRLIKWTGCCLGLLIFFCLNAGRKGVQIYSTLDEARKDAVRPLVLVFFSIDCSVCWDDLFEMNYFIQKNNLQVQLVGVSRDREKELRRFLAKYSFSEPVVVDRKGVLYRRFGVDLEPVKIVLYDDKIIYQDDYYQDFYARREKVKACLLKLARR